MGLTFATPWWSLVALAGVAALVAAALRERGNDGVRAALGLERPARAVRLTRPLALALVFALAGAAAAQPALRRQHARSARADAQLLLVLDSSRSMVAARNPQSPARAVRAVAFARRLQRSVPDLPVGVASLTNRLLPYLFPTSQQRAFSLVLRESYGIEQPPPSTTLDRWVTTFAPLSDLVTRDYFTPGTKHRVVVVLTDAETRSFAAGELEQALRNNGTTVIVVRFWRRGERIFRPDGSIEAYRPSNAGASLLRATGWTVLDERDFGGVLQRVRAAAGSGPTHGVALERRDEPLAPLLALLALCPLLLLVVPRGQLRSFRRGRPSYG
jgi:hypothetical protein